jgi:hypothetical protein
MAGLGLPVGVGMGNADGVIGGGVAYGLGQIDAIMPADVNDIGGLAKFTTPIWLLYRMLLGSALASMGACASALTVHKVGVSVLELRMLGSALGGGPRFSPYWLKVVARHKFDEIQVLVGVALLPCKNEYGYHCPFGD